MSRLAWLRLPWLFNRRVGVALLWTLLVVTAAVGYDRPAGGARPRPSAARVRRALRHVLGRASQAAVAGQKFRPEPENAGKPF